MQRTMNWITALIFLYAGVVCYVVKPETYPALSKQAKAIPTQTPGEQRKFHSERIQAIYPKQPTLISIVR